MGMFDNPDIFLFSKNEGKKEQTTSKVNAACYYCRCWIKFIDRNLFFARSILSAFSKNQCVFTSVSPSLEINKT